MQAVELTNNYQQSPRFKDIYIGHTQLHHWLQLKEEWEEMHKTTSLSAHKEN